MTQSILFRPLFALALCLCGLMVTASVAEAAPANWSCDDTFYEDGVCDCGCGTVDVDCPPGTFVVCERSGCRSGQVPWEHSPGSCMSSACGDGWADVDEGEVCDDGEGLSGGGCNADCSEVNAGWVCGERAEQCEQAPDPVEPHDTDAGMEDDATSQTDAGSDVSSDDASETDISTDDGAQADVAAESDSAADKATSNDESGCNAAAGGAGVWSLAMVALLGLRRRRA